MGERKRIRIVSTGEPLGMTITDAETGATIPGVVGVSWEQKASDYLSVAHLTTHLAAIDVTAFADAPIPDDAAFVARLDAVASALSSLTRHADGTYPREVSGPLQSAASLVVDALCNVVPPPEKVRF